MASQTAERYGGDMRLIASTAILAEKLFEKLQPIHGMGHRELVMLKVARCSTRQVFSSTIRPIQAQLLHHSEYGAARITLEERRIIAMIARYHRKSIPKQQHPDYMALPPDTGRSSTNWRRFCVLPAVLRLHANRMSA